MNESSLKRLAKVHPLLRNKITDVAETLAAQGIAIEVVQGLRTYAEQDALYAQGRTKPGNRVTNARGGQSNHNFGLAVDVCPFEHGQFNWNAPHATWEAIGKAGEAEGLEWGGRWVHIVDMPHLQLHGPTVAECHKLYLAGGLPAVWAKIANEEDETDTQPLAIDPPVDEPPAPETPPTTSTTVEHHDFVQTIAANDTVKEIAKSGVTSIGTRVSTGLATGGLLSAADAFIQKHYVVLIFSGGLILLAVIVVLFILWHKSQQQKLVAQINSDPTRADVRL